MKVVALGRAKAGKLTIHRRADFDRALSRFKDCPVIISVEKAHATRSKAQNDYLWAVVNARIAERWKKDPKQVHEILKAIHLPHDLAQKGLNGTLMNGYVIGGTTTKLDKLQFIEYLEAIVMWSAERDIVIPDPDPLWRQHAEGEREKEMASAS